MKNLSSDMDSVRQKLLDLVNEQSTNLANVSRAIGKNHAYLHQFIHREKPKNLPEMVRHALALHFLVDEDELLSPGQKLERVRLKRRLNPRSGAPSGESPAYLSSFAERLTHSRAESGHVAPLAFAQAAGIGLDRYLVLEDGGDDPSLDELDRISRISGKSLEWLIRGDLSTTEVDKAVIRPTDELEEKRHL